MRTIDTIAIHCSATKEGQHFTATDIRKWHVEKNGWKDIGYHFVVLLGGSVDIGRPIAEVGAHVAGHNATSIGICYVGGVDSNGNPKDTRTLEQKVALRALVDGLRAAFPTITKVCGHRDFPGVNKACPSFDVQTQL